METLNLLRSGQLAGSKRLKLACGLTQFPSEIFALADSLEILDLSNNHLRALPDEFERLKHLKIVFFTNNDFAQRPRFTEIGERLTSVFRQVYGTAKQFYSH